MRPSWRHATLRLDGSFAAQTGFYRQQRVLRDGPGLFALGTDSLRNDRGYSCGTQPNTDTFE